jgi:hypothetical protein
LLNGLAALTLASEEKIEEDSNGGAWLASPTFCGGASLDEHYGDAFEEDGTGACKSFPIAVLGPLVAAQERQALEEEVRKDASGQSLREACRLMTREARQEYGCNDPTGLDEEKESQRLMWDGTYCPGNRVSRLR